ncbi:cytochrome-c peroxidase [Pseudovibrio brasiliensis]|uniref:Cytochrome-c peroxidase n=1 Tax=Pseudovibrio brasiliensis TaxID=1898042 RepID=A0ABX8AV36_9HYPH|nr:cytochrome c peroxidase [Pseudovibrio brasiliensis]QUS58913.1 cytochrome-c peroxidase [Pseudovibrio brasiliensis]
MLKKITVSRVAAAVSAAMLLLPAAGAVFAQTPSGEPLRVIYQKPVSEWPAPTIDEGVEWREMAPLQLPKKPEKGSKEHLIAVLGAKLFDDPILSKSGQISCQSCHNRELGWADGVKTSFGHDRQRGNRNAPAVITAVHRPSLFWDGRAATLEEQALGPIENPIEMAAELDKVLERLNTHDVYPEMFFDAFAANQISADLLATAIASFERGLERKTRLDLFMEGRHSVLSDSQIRGLHLFRTKARCMNCHNGPALTDGKFHNLGLTYFGKPLEDLGRYQLTNNPKDVGAFATPSLRHIRNSAPYMHNGVISSLRKVVLLYNFGGGRERPRTKKEASDPLFPKHSKLLQPLKLNRTEVEDLVSFLEAL